MKHVLIIAFDFPPIADSGVYRTLKFVKYLPNHGWRCTVLSGAQDAQNLANRDDKLLEQIAPSTRIIRARILNSYELYKRLGGSKKEGDHSLGASNSKARARRREHILAAARELFHRLIIPDSRVGWYLDAVRQARALFATDPPDAIFSTSPRETAHVIAHALATRYNTRWIADFRDPWVDAFFAPKRPWPVRQINEWMQSLVVRRADAITVAWPELVNILRARTPQVPRNRFHVITNGYDPYDFETVSPKNFGIFTIVHTGRFLYPQRTPDALLQGLALLFERERPLRKHIRVVFVGPIQDFVEASVTNLGLDDTVHRTGRLTHHAAISYLRGANCLFFQNSWNASATKDQHEQHFVPGKLFEYLGARRPILAIVQAGSESERILSSTHQASLVAEPTAENMCKAVRACYERDAAASASLPPPVSLYQYDRRVLTKRLAALLDSKTHS